MQQRFKAGVQEVHGTSEGHYEEPRDIGSADTYVLCEFRVIVSVLFCCSNLFHENISYFVSQIEHPQSNRCR